MVDQTTLKQLGVSIVGIAVAALIAVALYWWIPATTSIGAVEVTLGLLVFAGGALIATRLASNVFPGYDVAEVEVDDIITRDGGAGPTPFGGMGLSANDIVEQIERADADENADALIVTLNTPGGEVVPSEDIRAATEAFDGPTVAYAEDMAASGGYWIASGADEFHAREAAIVGSIGVNGTQLGRTGLAEKVGLDYRRFVAGEYKDTPSTWRELNQDEIEYFQGLLDDWYDQFIDTVVEGRDLEEEFVRDTEARIYPGEQANDLGLVDYCGSREAMEDRLADRLGVDEITVESFEPERGLGEKLSIGAQKTAEAFGTGVAKVLAGDDSTDIHI